MDNRVQVYRPEQEKRIMSLDRCIEEWLDSMYKNSESEKTKKAYTDGITDFRATLHIIDLDLDADASTIAPIARRWCDFSKESTPEQIVSIAPATFNQRRSILSSFYKYAMVNEVLSVNPIDKFKRRKSSKKDAARALTVEEIVTGLQKINVDTDEGKRDRALLAIAFTTGYRVSEIAGLCLGDITPQGKKAKLFFRRCKGNESNESIIDEKTTSLLFDHLTCVYSGDFSQERRERPDAPVWISYSNNPEYRGQKIGVKALERMCLKYFGFSKFHLTRHSSAVLWHKQGASLAEIGKYLHHKNLKTTSDYLEELLGDENQYASDIADLLGL